MLLTTRLSLLAAAALSMSACARTSPDSASSEVPGTPEPTRANNEDVGLEPQGDPIDQVGNTESLKPTDGASAPAPGTQDTGNPGGSTVQEPPFVEPDKSKPNPK